MDRNSVVNLLRRHAPGDALEAAHVATVLGVLEAAEDPFSRSSTAVGHVTASGFVLSPEGDRLLLILHPTLGRWLQPGGHLESGDTDIVGAARREVQEETGLTQLRVVPAFPELLDVDVHAIPANPRRGEGAHLHLDLRVLFQAEQEQVQAGGGVAEVRWVALADVVAQETDASVLRAVRRIGQVARVAR